MNEQLPRSAAHDACYGHEGWAASVAAKWRQHSAFWVTAFLLQVHILHLLVEDSSSSRVSSCFVIEEETRTCCRVERMTVSPRHPCGID